MSDIRNYGEDSLQTVKVFAYNESNKSTYVFVHGGAWVDINNTYDDFKDMVSYIKDKYPNTNLFGINYRLSPSVKHPVHLLDVWTALQYVANSYKVKDLTLVGHSAGATLILQLLNWKRFLSEITVPQLFTVANVVFLDGIYDIAELIKEYPHYNAFVSKAFPNPEHASQLSWKHEVPQDITPKNILVLHSLDDELLSLNQTHLLQAFLDKTGLPYKVITEHWGLHDEMYRDSKVAEIVATLDKK